MDDLTFLTTLCVGEEGVVGVPRTGLKVWLDASDADTITVVTGVSEWEDKSGTGNTVTQATEVNQPTYATDVQNGLNCIQFDTSSWWLTKSSPTDVMGLSAMTIFIVSTAAQTGSLRQVFGCWLPGGDNKSWRVIKDANTANRRIMLSTNGSTDSLSITANAGSTNTFYLTTVKMNATTTSISHAGTTASGATPGATATKTAALIVGGQEGNTALWDGYVGEILFYNRALTAEEVASVTLYLTNKWDL